VLEINERVGRPQGVSQLLTMNDFSLGFQQQPE
jgi:hypothetical protein